MTGTVHTVASRMCLSQWLRQHSIIAKGEGSQGLGGSEEPCLISLGSLTPVSYRKAERSKAERERGLFQAQDEAGVWSPGCREDYHSSVWL